MIAEADPNIIEEVCAILKTNTSFITVGKILDRKLITLAVRLGLL